MVRKPWLLLVLVLLAIPISASEPPELLAPPEEAVALCEAQIDRLTPAGLPEPLRAAISSPRCTSPLCRTVEDCLGFPCGDYTFCMGTTQLTCGTCQCY